MTDAVGSSRASVNHLLTYRCGFVCPCSHVWLLSNTGLAIALTAVTTPGLNVVSAGLMARAAARAISQATLLLCQARIANQTAGASDTVGRLTPYTASQLVSAPLLCSLYFYSDTDGELKLASIIIAEGD